MPDFVTTRIEGDKEVIRAFQQAPRLTQQIMQQTMRQANVLMLGTLKPYPPQPPRDRAKTFNTYVRSIGRFPLSSFTGGQRKGKGAYKAGPRGGTVHRTSERLGSRWSTKVTRAGGGWLGITQNSASYAEYVQGQKQPYYHLQTGWVTTFAAKVKNLSRITQMFRDAARQLVAAVRRMAGGS